VIFLPIVAASKLEDAFIRDFEAGEEGRQAV